MLGNSEEHMKIKLDWELKSNDMIYCYYRMSYANQSNGRMHSMYNIHTHAHSISLSHSLTVWNFWWMVWIMRTVKCAQTAKNCSENEMSLIVMSSIISSFITSPSVSPYRIFSGVIKNILSQKNVNTRSRDSFWAYTDSILWITARALCVWECPVWLLIYIYFF